MSLVILWTGSITQRRRNSVIGRCLRISRLNGRQSGCGKLLFRLMQWKKVNSSVSKKLSRTWISATALSLDLPRYKENSIFSELRIESWDFKIEEWSMTYSGPMYLRCTDQPKLTDKRISCYANSSLSNFWDALELKSTCSTSRRLKWACLNTFDLSSRSMASTCLLNRCCVSPPSAWSFAATTPAGYTSQCFSRARGWKLWSCSWDTL